MLKNILTFNFHNMHIQVEYKIPLSAVCLIREHGVNQMTSGIINMTCWRNRFLWAPGRLGDNNKRQAFKQVKLLIFY